MMLRWLTRRCDICKRRRWFQRWIEVYDVVVIDGVIHRPRRTVCLAQCIDGVCQRVEDYVATKHKHLR